LRLTKGRSGRYEAERQFDSILPYGKSRQMSGKILLVGSSGFVGERLAWRLGSEASIATYHTHPFAGGIHFDIATMRLADRFLTGRHAISHAVLLHGMNKIDHCARHPEETAKVNVAGTMKAIDDLLDAGVKPIYLSSDAVFDGSRGPWRDEDATCPILTYGRQKATVEQYLSTISSPWIVARLAKVVGDYKDPRNLLSEWLETISRHQIVRCASDQMLSPIDVNDVVDAIVFFIESTERGLFNICGSQVLSRYELLQMLLSFADGRIRRSAKIDVCSLSDIPLAEPRPKNCSMSNRKFLALSGMSTRPMEQLCERICHNYAQEATAYAP
jgi:dTDP-4-dehydrorhamnose reductase